VYTLILSRLVARVQCLKQLLICIDS